MANLNLSQFTEKTLVADADWVFVWDTVGAISKKVSRNSLLSVGSIATSTPVTISQTWNDAAVAFAAMKIVATDTNSLATSDFLELYSGTSTQPLRLDIQKTGQVNIYGTWTNSTTYERLSLSAPTAANAIIGTNRSGGTARGLDFHTEGTARMTIGTTGNVGIGTTAPSTLLDIRGANSVTTGLQVGGTSAGAGNFITLHGNATNGGASQIYSNYNTTEGLLILGTYANRANQLALAVSGNVGVGTTAPSSKLDVAGAVTAAGYFTATSGGVSLGANGLWQQATGHLTLPSTAILGWSAGANVNVDQPGVTRLQSEGSGILALRNSTNPQTFYVYGTWTTATTNFERLAIKYNNSDLAYQIAAEKGTTNGDYRPLQLWTGGAKRLIISEAGAIIQRPLASVTPSDNGDLVVEATSNSLLTFKFKGSDGTVRSGTIALV